ncbi:MAG: hypothetical protein U0324_30325 [Polyangiales bacterium]
MPGSAHETLVSLLQQRPEYLDALLVARGRRAVATSLTAKDSALRVANPLEVRPDVVLLADGERGAWVVVEVQRGRDDDKQRKWLAAAGLLLDARRAMGDVVVITHDASVARWAEGLCAVEGPGGTRLWLEPVVIQLTLAEVDALLAPGRAELALFAAWAVHDQSGARARAVVTRAAETLRAVQDPALRYELTCAMIAMLDEQFSRIAQEILSMKPLVLPENAVVSAFVNTFQARGKEEGKAEGVAEGKADALLQLLTARGVAVDDEARARILACRDLPTLDRWFLRAVTATSTAAVLADN